MRVNLLKKSVGVITLLFLQIFTAHGVLGQDKGHYSISCINAIKCDKENSGCSVNETNRFRLNIKGLPAKPNTDFFVAECVGLEQGQVCTTGSADSAAKLQWESLPLLNDAAYSFTGLYEKNGSITNQPQKFTSSLDQLEWKSNVAPGYFRSFIAVYQPTDKYQDFNSACTPFISEPLIKIFDIKTLEPVENAKISLLQKIGASYVPAENPGLKPEYFSKKNGALDIELPKGEFKINISHPLYETASRSDYQSDTVSNIYPNFHASSSAAITTNETPQILNIGLYPKPGTLGYGSIKIMSLSTYTDKKTGDLYINGAVSHPMSSLEVFSVGNLDAVKSGQLSKPATSDKSGIFSIVVSQRDFKPDERLGGITVSKSKYLATGPESVSTESAAVKIDPIPLNLSGYAYDKKGRPISMGQVEVKLPFSKTPLSETTTDESGYYSIDQTLIPPIPFILEYKNTEASAAATISEFITQNAAFLKLSAIDKKMFSPDTVIKKQASAGAEIAVNQPARYALLRPVDKNPYVFWSVVASIFILGIGSTVAGASLIKKSHHSHA